VIGFELTATITLKTIHHDRKLPAMQEPNMSSVTDLEQRVAHLEKISRRWKRIAGVVVLGLIASLLVAAEAPTATTDEVRTRKLTFVDQDGRTLGEITSDAGKFAGLKFYNPQTHAVVSAIGINTDKTGFLLSRTMILVDEQGRTISDLIYVKDKASGLRFYNPDTKFCVSGFGIGADGSGVEYVNTLQGKQVIVHTGAVNDKGVPLEDVQRAIDQFRRAAVP
jgi:hypothetical protein